MNDTSPEFQYRVAAHYAALSPFERLQIASGLYDTARAIIASSLPPDLSDEERRYAVVKRLYGDELPEAALRAHARYPGPAARHGEGHRLFLHERASDEPQQGGPGCRGNPPARRG